MKKGIFIICLALLTVFVGCAPKEVPAQPEVKQTEDNGADEFLRGQNPDFMKKFAE